MTLREFANAHALQQHYREVRARTKAWGPRPASTPSSGRREIETSVGTDAPEGDYPMTRHADGEGSPHMPPPSVPAVQTWTPIRMTPMERIMRAVAAEFGVSVAVIRSRSRFASDVAPRHVAALLAKELTNMSFNHIGMFLGGCDHSTVLHAVASMTHKIARDRALAEKVQRLRDQLLEKDDERCDEQDSERARDCGSSGPDAAASGPVVECQGDGSGNL
jgi:hypothetical protein